MRLLLFVCAWLAWAAVVWFGVGAAVEWWQQPMPAVEPASPAPSAGERAVPDGEGELAPCSHELPDVPRCALDGSAR
jgi:hypothetical protein